MSLIRELWRQLETQNMGKPRVNSSPPLCLGFRENLSGTTTTVSIFKKDNRLTPEIYLEVKSMEDLDINTSIILCYKKGDLNLIHTRTWECTLRGDSRKMVLKQMDCLDESIYNMKIHEANLMLNFRTHPNLINLTSVWKTQVTESFSYKNIFLLMEHCTYGNVHDLVWCNFKRFPEKIVLKYLTDFAKGLNFIHHNDSVHGGIRLKNLLVNRKGDGVLGLTKKCELESMRKTKPLLSQFCMDRTINDYFLYWAPELLLDQGISKASDIWAFGIVIFLLSTGQTPFIVNKKDNIFNSISAGLIRWELLDTKPQTKFLLKNMLVLEPKKRWSSEKVFNFFQDQVVSIIFRFGRRTIMKMRNLRKLHAAVMIQHQIKGFIARMRYKNDRATRRHHAAVKLQKFFRNLRNSKEYRKKRRLVLFLQAQVLSRQTRRSYHKLRGDVIKVQTLIRKSLAYSSYTCVKMHRQGIVKDLAGVNGQFLDINKMMGLYFSGREYQNGFNENINVEGHKGPEQTENVKKTFNVYGETNKQTLGFEEGNLQEKLGPKYNEFEPQLEEIKGKLKQANRLYALSKELPIKLAAKKEGDIWEKTNEPFNVSF